MLKNISPELLRKYLSDECTIQEIEEVQAWYETFAADNDLLADYSELEQLALQKEMLSRVKSRIENLETVAEPRSGHHSLYWMASAAALILILLKVFIFNGQSPAVLSQSFVALEYTNTSKTIIKQILPDGSKVWLSPMASLSYPKSFKGSKTREVKMVGQAFFEVVKDHEHPFIIHSGKMITRVWGTSFQVTALPNSTSAKVVVVTGKVSVKIEHPAASKATSEVMLTPNQQVTYVKNKDELKKDEHGEMAAVKIWQKVNLSFNNVPVTEVIAVLNKEFNVNITTEDQRIGAFVLKADFSGQNFPDVMEMIKKSLGVDYQIEGRDVFLKLNNK